MNTYISRDKIFKEKTLAIANHLGLENFNIDDPKTWCEKMAWLQIHDDIYLRARCADKINVHKYSIERLGKDICVPIIKIYDSPDDIVFSELPNQFVLKCNHGYNMNIICRDKSQLNEDECKEKLKTWLNTRYGTGTWLQQPHYLKIEPKCFVEKYIENKGQQELIDYKFWCFNGEPRFVKVCSNRNSSDFCLNYYDMNFNFLPEICQQNVPNNPSISIKKPENFELMKEYARALSFGFPFVRVDFYEVDGVLYLGEMTFTPCGCFIKWTNPNIDRIFGDMIKLPHEHSNNTNHGISICVTAYDTAEYIEECLDSISNQTWFSYHDNYEIIVGIDGCEKTLEKVKQIMHKYNNLKVLMMDKNVGTYVTSNTIMQLAQYDWILRFDSDDIMRPYMIQILMDNNYDAEYIQFGCWKFGNVDFHHTNTGVIAHGAVMLSKQLFNKLGGYKGWICSGDDDFTTRVRKTYTLSKTIERVLFDRRVHDKSLTKNKTTNFNSDIRKQLFNYMQDETNYDNYLKCINDKIITASYHNVL